MVRNTKEKRVGLTIRFVSTRSYRKASRITIGKIPRKTQGFFKPLREQFAAPAWKHFCGLVMSITVGHCSTIERLGKLLRGPMHRTNHGEFLWRSGWDESSVIQQMALDTLKRLRRKKGGKCYLIIDETQTLKRAKKPHGLLAGPGPRGGMAGVGKLFHHATGKYGTGHTILKVCLWYRGVTIPWGSWLWSDTCTWSMPLMPGVPCLTHVGLKDQRAQGHKKNTKVLRLVPISQLKTRMRQLVWQEAVEDVVKQIHENPVIPRLEKLLAA